MHKDLSEATRAGVERDARIVADAVNATRESLAIAREAWLNAFDAMAEQLDKGE